MSDHYKLLGVASTASENEIKKAFHKLSLVHHPDKGGDPEMFKRINQAYSELSKRRESLVEGESSNIFEQMMRSMNINIKQMKRQTFLHLFNVSLRDVHLGVSKDLKLQVTKPCSECNTVCCECKGTGTLVKVNQIGPFMQQIQHTCVICKGSGRAHTQNWKCLKCNGMSVINEDHLLKIEVRKCMQDRERVMFAGLGEQPVTNNEQAGDLIVEVVVDKDPYFVRENNNLIYNSRLTLIECFLGKQILVPHFDEDININTNIFGIIDQNKRYHISGKGLGGIGDLIFTFEISYPQKVLTDTDRNALKVAFTSVGL